MELGMQLCGRQRVTWRLPGVSCSIKNDICLVLNFYRFSCKWLAGGSYWRNMGGCQHAAVRTKPCKATGRRTFPAGPGNSHGQSHHADLAGCLCPEATGMALEGPAAAQGWWQCQHLPRAHGNANSCPGLMVMPAAAQGRLGDSKEKPLAGKGAGSFQKRQESKAGEGRGFTYGGTRGNETASMEVNHIKVKRRGHADGRSGFALVGERGRQGTRRNLFCHPNARYSVWHQNVSHRFFRM